MTDLIMFDLAGSICKFSVGLMLHFPFPRQEFRRTLKRLYGSVHAGWVKYLDVTEARDT